MWSLNDIEDFSVEDSPCLYLAPIRYEHEVPEDGFPYVRPYSADQLADVVIFWFQHLPAKSRKCVRFVAPDSKWPYEENAGFRLEVERADKEALSERFFSSNKQHFIDWDDGQHEGSFQVGLNGQAGRSFDPWAIEAFLTGSSFFDVLMGACFEVMAAYTARYRVFADSWPSFVPGEALLSAAGVTERCMRRPQLIGPGFPGRMPHRLIRQFVRASILEENGAISVSESVTSVLDFLEKVFRIRWIVTEKQESHERLGYIIYGTRKYEEYQTTSVFLRIAQKRIEDYLNCKTELDEADRKLFRACRIPFGTKSSLQFVDVAACLAEADYIQQTNLR